MHPLLTRNRLGLYLLGWIPLAATLVLLMTSGGNLSWLESTVIAIPLCAVYAFICLSAWYTAKSSPIKRESALRLIGVHSLAAALVSYFWMGLGWVLVAWPPSRRQLRFKGWTGGLLHKPRFSSALATCFICFPWHRST